VVARIRAILTPFPGQFHHPLKISGRLRRVGPVGRIPRRIPVWNFAAMKFKPES
jgi:hypothetical protein